MFASLNYRYQRTYQHNLHNLSQKCFRILNGKFDVLRFVGTILTLLLKLMYLLRKLGLEQLMAQTCANNSLRRLLISPLPPISQMAIELIEKTFLQIKLLVYVTISRT